MQYGLYGVYDKFQRLGNYFPRVSARISTSRFSVVDDDDADEPEDVYLRCALP